MKILVVTKNWLGDILFEIPAIEMIRARYPEAEILCLTHPRCREILELHPAVTRVIPFDEKESSFFEKIRLIFRLRKEKIGSAYFFHRSRTRAFLLMLAGIPERTGYSLKKQNFLTRAFEEPEEPIHHVDYFVRLLEKSGFQAPENPSYTFHFSGRDLESAQKKIRALGLQQFVCFHLGANWEPKRWPAEHFAELAKRITEKWNLPIILTGGPGDKFLGDEVMKKAACPSVYSLIGETRLGELAALFSQALFVISGDSGPMHIASGAGARVLALFGPTDPKLTGPRGIGEKIILSFIPKGYHIPWYGENFPKEGWLSQISPAEVLSALEAKHWNRPQADFSGPFFHANQNPERRQEDSVKQDKHILLNTLSNIGDVILTTPVLMSLVEQFPEHRLTVIVGPRARGILEGSRFIDKLVIYDKQAGLKEKIAFIQTLRERHYEAAVDLKNSAIPFLVSAKKRSSLFRSFKKMPAREKHLGVLAPMGLKIEKIPPFDFYNTAEEKKVLDKLKSKGDVSAGYAVVAPIAASEIKTWPLASFQKTIEGLLRETPYSVVLAGGVREAALAEPLVQINPARVFNMAGETTLREFAALIGKSELLLANDSSAAQLGFEMNHPSAVIFGPTDSRKFARFGENFRILFEKMPCLPCEKSACRFERQACLLDLTPETVLNACLQLLSRNRVKTLYVPGQVNG